MARAQRDTRVAPDDRQSGFEAAVGLLTGSRRRDRVDGRTCNHCGSQARIDMIDMARTRAYLTCLSCGNEWDIDRVEVLRSKTG